MAPRRTPGTGQVRDLWRDAEGNPTARDGRGLRWRAVYVNVLGKQETSSFALQREAKKWLSGRQAETVTHRHTVRAVGDTPLRVYWEMHKEMLTSKPSVAAKQASIWRTHIKPRWADTAVSEMTPAAVRTWIAELHRKGVSPSVLTAILEVLRPTLDLAQEHHAVPKNPARGIPVPKASKKSRAYLSHAQVEQLALAMPRADDALLVRFLAYTGLRFGEAAALRPSDLTPPRVHVRRAIAEVEGKLIEGTPKTHEQRSVVVPSFLLAELKGTPPSRDRLFLASRGGTLRINTWRRRVWNPAVESLGDGFPDVTPHDLRHTAASLAVSAGANVKAVQRMLGHASAAMTLDTYADLFDSDLAEVADRLDAAREAAVHTPCVPEDQGESQS